MYFLVEIKKLLNNNGFNNFNFLKIYLSQVKKGEFAKKNDFNKL